MIGINDYFGWYPGPGGADLRPHASSRAYLDTVRKCYPKQALMVTEFGAEANRDGPPEEKGTLRLPAGLRQLPPRRLRLQDWLSGAVYWALNEFKVRPGWDGGNPRPTPPRSLHQKGLLRYGDLSRKPAWADLRAATRPSSQVG